MNDFEKEQFKRQTINVLCVLVCALIAAFFIYGIGKFIVAFVRTILLEP